MWRFFENSRTVNCQTRFLCSSVAITESHGSCSASFCVHFLFVLLDRAKTHNPALEKICNLLFRSYIVAYRLLTLAKTDAEICYTYPCHRD